MERFFEAVGWLVLFVVPIPVLDLLLTLVGSRLRLELDYAVGYGFFAVLWFLAALPVVALLWVVPPLPRAAVATVVVYLVALVVPFASPFARYPVHVIRCGRLPVVASRFAGDATFTNAELDDPDFVDTTFHRKAMFWRTSFRWGAAFHRAAFHGEAELKIRAELAEVPARNHFGHGVDRGQDVSKPDDRRPLHQMTRIASCSILGRSVGCKPSRVIRSTGRPSSAESRASSRIKATKSNRS